MVPCIQLTRINGQIYSQPVEDIRHIQEESGWVEIISISTRQSIRVEEAFNTIVNKSAFDLVPFQDAGNRNKRKAVNRAYVSRVLELGDGTAKIVLKTQQSFYPVETYAMLSPLFEKVVTAGGTGDITDGANVGTGVEIFKQKAVDTLEFRTIIDGTGTTVEQVGNDEVKINVTSSSGITRTVLLMSSLSVTVKHTGTAPTLAKLGDGDFQMTVPTGSILMGMTIRGSSATIHSSTTAQTFRIADTDGHLYKLSLDYWSLDLESRIVDANGAGLTSSYSDSGGTRTYIFQNMGFFGAQGFDLVCSTN